MAENPIRHGPRFSGAQSKPNIYEPNSEPLFGSEPTGQTHNSHWKSLLIEMLNETNQAKRELAALALEEAIYERHRELTGQRSFTSESMAERMKMKDAFLRVLDVKSQVSLLERAPLPLEFRHVRDRAPDWGRAEAEAGDWRSLLLRMLGENDQAKLALIAAALEDEIFVRYQQLASRETREAVEERRELQLACDRLSLVKIKVLGYGNRRKAG